MNQIDEIDNVINLRFNTISKSSGTFFYSSENDENVYLDDILKNMFKFNLKPVVSSIL